MATDISGSRQAFALCARLFCWLDFNWVRSEIKKYVQDILGATFCELVS